jgi:hypothetical protein
MANLCKYFLAHRGAVAANILCQGISANVSYTKATVTPTWSGARPREIPSRLWFSGAPGMPV